MAMVVSEKEKALVLCGGGGKGAFQIGAWKVLEESGILGSVTAISGTSVGALNAALFALGDYEKAFEIWSGIRPNTLLPAVDFICKVIDVVNNPDETISRLLDDGIFSRRGLEKIMDSLDLGKITNSKRKVFVGVSNATSMLATEYIELNGKCASEIKEYLLASSAIPLVYPQEKIGRKKFVDGGFLCDLGNTPILPVYRAGYRDIVIVALDADFSVPKMKDFLLEKVNADNFSGCNFTVIKPSKSLGGTLDFSHERIMDRLLQGYHDASAQLGRQERANPKTAELAKKLQWLDAL